MDKQLTEKKSGSWKQNVLISMVAVIFILIAMEVLLRIAGYGNVEVYEPDETLIWRLKPNQDTFTKFGKKPVHINTHGLRDDEYSLVKPPRTCRILVLGNSCTYGWGVGHEDTYSSVLESKLNADGDSVRYEVINGGVIGYSIGQEYEYLKSDGLRWNPDIVLISHTFNEGKRVNPDSPRDVKDRVFFSMQIKNILRNVALYHFVVEFNFSSQYVKLARKVTEDPTWIEDDAFARYRSNLQGIADLCSLNHIKPVFLITVAKNQIMQDSTRYSRHQQAMIDAADANNISVVNFMNSFKLNRDRELYIDGGHPNELGHRLMAQDILNSLKSSSRRLAIMDIQSLLEGTD